MPTLIHAGLIRKKHLDEDLRYEPGSLIDETSRLPKTLQGGWDYFEKLVPDCLAYLEEASSEDVARFIRETSEEAKKFYNSGNNMRWYSVVQPFPTLLPLDQPALLLSVLGEVRENPASPALIRFLEKKRNWHLARPENLEDIYQVGRYADFIATLTQTGQATQNYLETLDLSALIKNYRGRASTEIVHIAELLENFSAGLGDNWLKKGAFDVRELDENRKSITIDNLDQVYATVYILKRTHPEKLKDIIFSWDNGINRRLSLGDLSRFILTAYRLREIFGDEKNPLKDIFTNLDVLALDLNLTNVPREFFDIAGLEKVRSETNQYTNNIGGDQFVLLLGQAVTIAPIKSIGIDNMVEAMKGWSRIEKISDVDLSRDVSPRYLLLAQHAGTRVRDYFENNPEELRWRYDQAEVLAVLKRLGRSMRPAPEVAILSSPIPPETPLLLKKEPKKEAESPKKQWPITKNISKPVPPILQPTDHFVEWVERVEMEGISLGDPRLSGIRLDNPKTLQSIRKEVADKTTRERGDRFIHRIYDRFFRDPVTTDNAGEYYHIARGILYYPDSFYHDWGNFAVSRLIGWLGRASEDDVQSISDSEEMLQWLRNNSHLDQKGSDVKKAVDGILNGRFGYVLQKGWAKTVGKFTRPSKGIAKELEGKLEFTNVSGALPGFQIKKILIQGKHQATLIIGDPKKGAHAELKIRPGTDGISHAAVEGELGSRLQYQGPVLMVSGGNKGVEIMIEKGKIVNSVFDPNRLDGYLIVYSDGTLHIADKRYLKLSELTRKKEDRSVLLDLKDPNDFKRFLEISKEERLSIVASLLFKNRHGENYTNQNDYPTERRFLLEFNDGRFGILDTEGGGHTINDLLSVAWRLSGVEKALYCDTGMYDLASYYLYPNGQKGERRAVRVGHVDADKSSNRLIFYNNGE
ncbi:MAG: hypothetical protein Q8P84_03000 [Deltaproteobacteria bacterium]|nr:hypothetical protein [Deltaproteobacteria bacterium]